MKQQCMVLFDLDGTLWDSSAQVAESWNLVLKQSAIETGDPLPVFCADDIRNVMGKTMDEIARVLLPEMDPAVRGPLFKTCETFEVEYITSHGGGLYPKVREVLGSLQNAGYPMAIVSNCQIGYIKAFLTSMQMDAFFCDYEEWGRTGLSKAENIRLVMQRNGFDQAVYVGDTIKDREAAVMAGVPFIWASYGFGELTEYEGRLNTFEELPDLLSSCRK